MNIIVPNEVRQAERRWSSARFAFATALASWLIYLAVAALRCVVYGFPNPLWIIQRHALTALIAVIIAVGLHRVLSRVERRPMGQRLVLALAATVPAAALLSVFNYNVMYVFTPPAYVQALGLDIHPGIVGELLHSSLENYFVFAGWAVLWIAVSNAVDTQELLRLAAASQAAARAAELGALRLQLDPHFLFNALNTVSGLIVSRRLDDADRTVEALSSFLRATLEADASSDVPLSDEVHLQKLYLNIEQIRFGDRLAVVFDIPDEILSAPVPALILQPLVENSIRHAVARTSRPVTVIVMGRADGDRLHLSVQDDGPGDRDAGHGLGLSNVAGRLRLRYAGNAGVEHSRSENGTTRTVIDIPYPASRECAEASA